MELRKIKIERDHGGKHLFIGPKEFEKANITTSQVQVVDKVNIRCLDKAEKSCVSWHYHDVFRKITYLYVDVDTLNDEYGPVYYLESDKLYSKTKLKKLAKSKNFKERNYSFFSYDFVEHLLGLNTKTDFGLSGLFK